MKWMVGQVKRGPNATTALCTLCFAAYVSAQVRWDPAHVPVQKLAKCRDMLPLLLP